MALRADLVCRVEAVPEDLGTSRMFRLRPVVGSRVNGVEGSWETVVPSMIYCERRYVNGGYRVGEGRKRTYVVPVSRPGLDDRGWDLEGSTPITGLLLAGKRELVLVVVP